MKRPLRLMHVMGTFEGGGMEVFVLRLANAQQKQGHKVSIVTMQGGPLQAQAEQSGITVRVLNCQWKAKRAAKAAFVMGLLRPDIVHVHNPNVIHYGLIGKLACRAPMVVTDHAQTRPLLRVPSAREWGMTDAVVAVSHHTARAMPSYGYHGPVTVIHNGIDVSESRAKRSREEVRKELGIEPHCPVAINVAAFVPVKAQDILVQALGQVRDRGQRLTVLLAGEGPERERVEQLAKDLDLGPEWIRFLGFRSDVQDLLQASDFFVLPSRLEGLSIAMLEAMAHKLPVVATPVGGNPELMTNEVEGLMVELDQPQALAQAMSRLVSEPEFCRALGEAGHKRVLTDFASEVTTQRYQDIYYQVLGEGQ